MLGGRSEFILAMAVRIGKLRIKSAGLPASFQPVFASQYMPASKAAAAEILRQRGFGVIATLPFRSGITFDSEFFVAATRITVDIEVFVAATVFTAR